MSVATKWRAAFCVDALMSSRKLSSVLTPDLAQHANGALADHRPDLLHGFKVLIKFGATAAGCVLVPLVPIMGGIATVEAIVVGVVVSAVVSAVVAVVVSCLLYTSDAADE